MRLERMLVGRDQELARVLDVCRAAASGHGSVLVVTGEPGIGKTSLLAAAGSDDWAAVSALGVEAESAVAFATLQGLLWPLRDALVELEAGQEALLRGVLELGPTVEGSAFAVGAAVLALLSVASERRPLVLVVDDAQWADVASQEVLCFVGRRLEHERIALVAAVREDEPCLLAEERGFARLPLRGIPSEHALALLEASSPGPLSPEVTERLLEACAGNPLGLVELPSALSEAQRRGEEPLPAALAAGPLVRRAFAARAEGLGVEARRALLVLAAAGEAEEALLVRAGVSGEALHEAEASGLVVRRGGTVEFRHPLVQSGVYGAASPPERREAHKTLARVTRGAHRTWHLAEAAEGHDEQVAQELEAAAAEAGLAGGVAVQGQALERAAALTAEPEVRARRLLAAAAAWRRAGRLEHASALLDHALFATSDGRLRAEIQLERGRMLMRQYAYREARELLAAEAERAAPAHPDVAARLYADAALVADVDPDGPPAVPLAERSLELAHGRGDRVELEALNALVVARTSMPAPPDEQVDALVSRAVALLELSELRAGSEEAHWIAYVLAELERDEDGRRLSDLALSEARSAGDVWSLCFGLYARAELELVGGRVDVARTWAGEAIPLAEQIGEAWRTGEANAVLAEVEASRGNVAGVERGEAIAREVPRYWNPLSAAHWELVHGRGRLAVGDFEEAARHLETAWQTLSARASRTWFHLVPLDLGEAYALAGARREAEAAVRRAAAGIEACRLVRPRARLARVRGLLAGEGRIDAAFSESLALLDQVPHQLERARLELNWGERLRAAGRLRDAVPHLDHALARFEALGADGWAGRARRVLEEASGVARPAQPRRTDVLTPQELRVARHAASGLRDREIAALLYLSPRTVHSHLQHAYRKLEVANRTQLAGVLAADGIRPLDSVTPSR
jgi:DNA-binding CsgD family transcriptional regulator